LTGDAAFATRRLSIEPLARRHAAGLVAALDDPRVGVHIGGPDVTTVAAMRRRIARLRAGPPPERAAERWWNFALRRQSDRAIIGRLEATTHGDWGEIAYVLGPAWWGQGYATEAATWLLEHMARHDVVELWAAIHPGNLASIRLVGRLGFAPAPGPARDVGSYDPGDLVFVRGGAAGSRAG
jgi:RimJ/RimL family protein N-acetyltransferase